MHLLVDRIGIKAEGEGEWDAHTHGGSIRTDEVQKFGFAE